MSSFLTDAPPKKYRCSRGHTWEASVKLIGMRFMSMPELAIEPVDLCMRCFYEMCREHLGTMREVK